MPTLTFLVGGDAVRVEVNRLLIAGFTGRDPGRVHAHVHELELYGIPAPTSVPAFYCVSPSHVVQSPHVQLRSSTVSGEAEAVLIFPGDNLANSLVAVGSDLTDRSVERHSIQLAKELPKPISREAWRYAAVQEIWDDLELASWVERLETSGYYQLGRLRELLPPEEVLETLPEEVRSSLRGTVLLLGTLPICTDSFRFSEYFACELRAPDGKRLRCEYTVEFAAADKWAGRRDP